MNNDSMKVFIDKLYVWFKKFQKHPIYVYNEIPNGVLDSTTKLGHMGIGIIINKKAKVGRYCVIGQNVTIGGRSVRKIHGNVNLGTPVIEDHVRICSNACVIGGVTVGHHSVIGAGAVVYKDIPPYSLVVGNCEIKRKIKVTV